MNGLAGNDDIMKKKDADLNKLKGEKLADCIIDDPEIIFKCDTRNITTQGWVDILCQHPKLAKYCNWEYFSPQKLGAFKKSMDIIDGTEWCELMIHHPPFAEICDWDKLTQREWDYLLLNRPEFSAKYSVNFSNLSEQGFRVKRFL